jgi:hypothetical protein
MTSDACKSDQNSATMTSHIANYYKNKSVFITGGSGFVGKALVEKLLRSCYDLNKIYLLLRHKKGKRPQQRLDEIVNCKVGMISIHFERPFLKKKDCLLSEINKMLVLNGARIEKS